MCMYVFRACVYACSMSTLEQRGCFWMHMSRSFVYIQISMECMYVSRVHICEGHMQVYVLCLWKMHRHYVRCLSVWSVCGCHRAYAFIKPPNTCNMVAKSTGFTDKLLGIELWLCHVLSVWRWANLTSGCLSFPICKMVIVISSTSQSCHWD